MTTATVSFMAVGRKDTMSTTCILGYSWAFKKEGKPSESRRLRP